MSDSEDWYPPTRGEERLMYGNIEEKIDGYAAKYPFMTGAVLAQVHAACLTFIEGYDKIAYNRATGKQATVWFDNIVSSKQGNATPAPPPPVYMPIDMPGNAFLGIEKFIREFRALLKSQFNYDRADGVDLMLEREPPEELNLNEVVPDLKIAATVNGTVRIEWKKTGFDLLELQYRKAGTELWQPAEKSTERVFEFAPPLTTPGVPEKFEFRAILQIKNQRVGQWSLVHTLTIG